jgi:hypothetical protein
MEHFDTGARIAVLENEVKNIGTDLKEIRKENKEQHKAMMEKMSSFDDRLVIIEKWRWMLIGGAAVVGYLIAHYFGK